jgi:hypothetical protein
MESQSNSPKQSTTPISQTQTKKKSSWNSRGNKNSTTGEPSVKNASSRNEKRARWAKSNRPKAKPSIKSPNVKEYISLCCSAPSHKPKAGQKETAKDPDSGKMKTAPKGLGHWRCGQCGKVCKVSAQKPVPREAKNSPAMPQFNVEGCISGRIQSTTPNQSAVPREEKNSPAMALIETAPECVVATLEVPDAKI